MDGPSKVVLESNRVGPRVTCSSPLEENYFLLDRSDLIINQAWPNFSQALHWLLSEEQKPKSKLWVWKFFWNWMRLNSSYFHLLSGEGRGNLTYKITFAVSLDLTSIQRMSQLFTWTHTSYRPSSNSFRKSDSDSISWQRMSSSVVI